MGTLSSKEESNSSVSIEKFNSRIPPSLIRHELNGYLARDDFYARSWAGLKIALNNLKTNSTRSNLSMKPTENIPFISFSNINFILTHFSTLETGFTKTPNNGFFISIRTLSPIVSNSQENLDSIDLLDWWFSNTDSQNLFKLSHPQRHLDCQWDEEYSSAGGWERQKGHYINHTLDFLLLLKRSKYSKPVNTNNLLHVNSFNLNENDAQTHYNQNSSATIYNNDYELNSHIIDFNNNDNITNYPSQSYSPSKSNSISHNLKWNPNIGGGCGLNGLNSDKRLNNNSNIPNNIYSKTRLRYQFLSPSSLNIDLKRLKIEGVVSCIVADIFISEEDKYDPYFDLNQTTESFYPKNGYKTKTGINPDYMEVLKNRIKESNKDTKINLQEEELTKEDEEDEIESIDPKVTNKKSIDNLIYIGKVLFITKNVNGNNITHIFYWLGCHDIVQDNLVSTTSLNSPHAASALSNNDSTFSRGKKDSQFQFSTSHSSTFNKDSLSFFSSSNLDSNLNLAKDLYDYSAEWMNCMREFLPSYVNQHYIKEQNLQYEYYQQQEEFIKQIDKENEMPSFKNFNFYNFNHSNNSNNSNNNVHNNSNSNDNNNLDTIYESEKSQSGFNSSNNNYSGAHSSQISLAPSIAFQQQQQFFNNYQPEDQQNSLNRPQSEYDLYQVAYHVSEDFGY